MEKDKEVTEVIFRVYKSKKNGGAVLALFPYLLENILRTELITCYEHVGQHGQGDFFHCKNITRPATVEEYTDLKKELEGIGYNLKVVKARQYKKVRKAQAQMTSECLKRIN